jgi:hypothetical protein
MTRLWAIAWIAWIAWFFAWEITALALRKPALTLSDFTWRLEGTGWTIGRYFILAGLIWATLHLAFGWLR